MRKNDVGFLLFFVLLILIIPAFSLVGRPSGQPLPELLPSNQTGLPGDSLSSAAGKASAPVDFYLVREHETGALMKLSPADYVKGVVAAEMPVSYHSEALKAQAVAAHTYALRQMGEQLTSPSPELNGAYLSTDPEHFQAWMSEGDMKQLWGENFSTNYQKLSQAVDAVISQALTYQNEPIIAAFHSISSGKTESAATVWGREVEYLSPVDSEGDELSPDYETNVVLKSEEVSHALMVSHPGLQLPKDPAQWFTLLERSKSGTVTKLTMGGAAITGRDIRESLKLRSANFTVGYQNGSFTFTTLGYGHGVGMSQYGADYLARQGKSYEDILTHYYTGVSLTEIK